MKIKKIFCRFLIHIIIIIHPFKNKLNQYKSKKIILISIKLIKKLFSYSILIDQIIIIIFIYIFIKNNLYLKYIINQINLCNIKRILY